MKVSVVIPAYNEEKYIKDCLTNLINQEEKPDEIIVVDNLSKDNTAEIVKKFDVTLIEARSQGIAQARDRGFNAAKNEIIARCDSDSIVPPDWIKKIKKNFANKNIDGLVGPIVYYDLPLKSTIYAKIFIHFMNIIQGHHTIIGNNMAISKTIWEKIRDKVCTENNIFHEDIDLAIHIHKHKGIIKYDPMFISYTSGRRIISNPLSFFVQYPIRLIKTLKARHL